jgi:hypothetical protein
VYRKHKFYSDFIHREIVYYVHTVIYNKREMHGSYKGLYVMNLLTDAVISIRVQQKIFVMFCFIISSG